MDRSLQRLAATNVAVAYGGLEVLTNAHFRLNAGTVTALVGPNGSGKSTLLRSVARLISHARGHVSLGEDVADARALSARDFAKRVTLLAQQRVTPVGITVRDVVEFGRHPYRSRWSGRDDGASDAIQRALELTGLADLQDERLETLSGGQLQRAWFASALAQDTNVLLLDEPTNHLDLRYQVEVLELIRQLADDHQAAIGVVLHDLNHAADVADHVVVLDRGCVVSEGAPAEALRSDLLTNVWGVPITVVEEDTGMVQIRTRRVRRPIASAC